MTSVANQPSFNLQPTKTRQGRARCPHRAVRETFNLPSTFNRELSAGLLHAAIVALLLIAPCANLFAQDTISLAGTWRFELDRADEGVIQQFQQRTLPGKLKLPGDLAQQGIGDRPSLDTKWVGDVQHPWWRDPKLARYSTPENFKFPYWLTPEHRYMGVAWYQRFIEIPPGWANRRVVLFLERPHWETRVWVDDKPVGTNSALGTPHEYDLGRLSPGRHSLTIRVDNRLVVDVGINSHSVSDHTQGNWNGIVGRLELRSTPLVWIDDLQIHPEVDRGQFRIKGTIKQSADADGTRRPDLHLGVFDTRGRSPRIPRTSARVTWSESGGTFEAELKPGSGAQSWSEFNPRLYEVVAVLGDHRVSVTTGLRKIASSGTQFTLNGQKIFFRGTLECAIFPKTGHPPTDVDSWKHVLKAARAHGLNQLRFHSWCPPEAAFVAADEMGFYYQVECSSWANQSTTIGDGKPIDRWIYEEADRILKYYGNHPSFVLMPYGNEPGGPKHREFLAEWVRHYREKDPRRLYTAGAGWPQLPENQFHVVPDPRIQGWGEGLKSRINAVPPETTTDYRDYISKRDVPVISHEIGQWCVYPNFDEIRKYTGYLKARNFEIFRDTLNANHMGKLSRQFLLASGKLQALCYKEDIESALRTPGMGGFQLLDLHDFPGQGTALVGVLDPFWEEKGYITPREYSRFCNYVVPLARMDRRVFTTEEEFGATLEVANFGPGSLSNARVHWQLVSKDGKQWGFGELPEKAIPIGNGVALATIKAALKNVTAPAQGKLVVSVEGVFDSPGAPSRGLSHFENDWDIWVYPAKSIAAASGEPEGDITITSQLDDPAVSTLSNGGKVLLLLPPAQIRPDPKLGKVGLGFSSIFWNTAWTQRQPPHTLGILCDPKHPLFASFPTEYHSNWQWWYLVHNAGAMILDDLPPAVTPGIRVIDDWVTNRRLGLLFEAKVGRGKLVVCSIDLEHDPEANPVRRQFRHSLLSYMSGSKFSPRVEVEPAKVRGLFAEPSRMQKLGARVLGADSAEAGYAPENVLDGDPRSFWHTRWRDSQPPFPHEIRIELAKPFAIRGFTALPRQDGLKNGDIKEYEFYASADGQDWGQPVKRGSFAPGKSLQTVELDAPAEGKFVRLVALSEQGGGPWAALAEFELKTEAD